MTISISFVQNIDTKEYPKHRRYPTPTPRNKRKRKKKPKTQDGIQYMNQETQTSSIIPSCLLIGVSDWSTHLGSLCLRT